MQIRFHATSSTDSSSISWTASYRLLPSQLSAQKTACVCCTCMYVHTCIRCVNSCASTYMHMHTCIHACVYMCACAQTRIRAHRCMRVKSMRKRTHTRILLLSDCPKPETRGWGYLGTFDSLRLHRGFLDGRSPAVYNRREAGAEPWPGLCHLHVYIHIVVCMCVHVYIYMYVRICIRICICICICICIYIYIYMVVIMSALARTARCSATCTRSSCARAWRRRSGTRSRARTRERYMSGQLESRRRAGSPKVYIY